MDLETLRAHLDTDERDAAEDHTLGCSIRDAVEEDAPLTDSDLCNCPAKRRLRWVRAAREILAEHSAITFTTRLGILISTCRCCSDKRGDHSEDWPCPTVRSVMSVYGDTDGCCSGCRPTDG